jgi:diaminohydroxyphosphoribosylaminopyrimidine deaminase/5-amino-6-(5-phosphoribosylamino)uracil reductase
LGDQGRGLFNLPALQKMADKKQLNMKAFRQVGPDLKLTFTIK